MCCIMWAYFLLDLIIHSCRAIWLLISGTACTKNHSVTDMFSNILIMHSEFLLKNSSWVLAQALMTWVLGLQWLQMTQSIFFSNWATFYDSYFSLLKYISKLYPAWHHDMVIIDTCSILGIRVGIWGVCYASSANNTLHTWDICRIEILSRWVANSRTVFLSATKHKHPVHWQGNIFVVK